jgi:hypothetical protein
LKPWKTNLKQKTVRAFEEWAKVEANWEELFRLIVDERKRLRDACVKLKQPYTLVYPFLHDGDKWQKRYNAALAAVGDDIAHERLEIADSVKGAKEPVEVMAAKLACDVRDSLASKWEPERYGDRDSGNGGGITVIVDRSCGGTVEISTGGATARIPLGNIPEALPAPALESQAE